MDMTLEPQYREKYKKLYGKEPKFLPVNIISNYFLPQGVERKSDYSRVWVKNPAYKEKYK